MPVRETAGKDAPRNPGDRPHAFPTASDEAILPSEMAEYEARIAAARCAMQSEGHAALVLTSMHNVAYLTGFFYCAIGSPHAAVLTADATTTASPNIDGAQPARRSIGACVA